MSGFPPDMPDPPVWPPEDEALAEPPPENTAGSGLVAQQRMACQVWPPPVPPPDVDGFYRLTGRWPGPLEQ